MRIRGVSGLWQSAQSLKSWFTSKALILVYHRIAELSSDPWSLAVTPRHFDQHLAILRQFYQPISFNQLAMALDAGRLPRRAVVVTFDDGYADNLHNAKPLLEHHDVPATFFLSNQVIIGEREYWWDELDNLLLQPGSLPAELCLKINETTYSCQLDEAAEYSKGTAERYRDWKAWEAAPTSRHALYYSLWELLHALASTERQKVVDELLKWAGVAPACRATHRALSVEEVVTLAQSDLVDIGAHTVTHPSLAALPITVQRYEIQQSKAQLEEVLGQPVTSFAYPYGKHNDYTKETMTLVQEAGFRSACSNVGGIVDRSTDPFQLPRIYVDDCDGERFARLLRKWSGVDAGASRLRGAMRS